MASSSLSHQQNALSGIEPPIERRRVEESSKLFDVFINHRGPDVKRSLATQLYNSFKERGIRAFLDSEEKELADSFPSTIETVIRSASIHIAIFSKKYAESAWCLAELLTFCSCGRYFPNKRQSKARIIPVFYQVKPSDLRYIEKGKYAKAFTKYEKKKRYLEKLRDWKEALQQVSFTTGHEFKNSDDCKIIVSAVEKEVQRTKLLHVAKHPVGLHKLVQDFERRCLDELVQDFESQCRKKKAAEEKANVVGILGMGGVGKTTLSKDLFNRKKKKYTRASFLFDVRETCANGKLYTLQRKLLKDIFCEANHSFRSGEDGTSLLRNCLEKILEMERSSSFSFLIVLDDIDHVQQLDALLPMDILNHHGNHLIIITTRDVGVLIAAEIYRSCHLKGFHKTDGTELFCWHAFNRPLPLRGYEDLVEAFVNLCGGLPLSLMVLGRHVFCRDQWYWQDELEKVKETLPGDIKRVLTISIDGLDNVEKQIFMDTACFFIEKSITKAMTIWEGSGWRARHALQRLKEKCLVEEVEVKYLNNLEWKWESSMGGFALRMHDHLRDLGREMANEVSHPRRLWRPRDLETLALKGFWNILAQTKGRCFHSIFDKSMGCEITYFLGEPGDGSDTSLLWLQLEYPSRPPLDLNSDINSSIFSWIPLQNLRCLRISNGCFQNFWESDEQAPYHLKELQIRNSFLEEFPDLVGKLNSLQKLVLDAKDVQVDIRSLLQSLRMNLRSLKMMGSALVGDLANNNIAEGATFKPLVINDFKRVWEGEVTFNNEGWSVENLEIDGCGLVTKLLINGNCCQRLQSLKICEMTNLIEADLSGIKTLNCLEITGCKKFRRLSVTPDPCNLLELEISGCLELEVLRLEHLSCLKKITVQNCNQLKSVSGISDLVKLVELKISGCHILELEELKLEHLSCLERITIQNCEYLKIVSGISNLAKLVELKIYDCVMLELEELRLAHLSCLEIITLRNCNQMKSLSGISNLAKLVELEICKCEKLEIEYFCFSGMKFLERITVDKYVKIKYFELDGCEKLKTIKFGCETIVNLSIRYCAELEKLPDLVGPSCLRRIIIDGYGNLKYLTLNGLENLESLELRQPKIIECPEFKELPSFDKMSSLEHVKIYSCEKLQNITLPTTLIELDVKSCRDLQRAAVAGDLTKLCKLCIEQCPALEQLPSLARAMNFKEIVIDSCDKLQNITLATTLFELDVQRCRDLQIVAVAGGLRRLTRLIIKQCPALEEFPSLARVSCLEVIMIEFCEKLRNIAVTEELQALEFLTLNYCSNAVIRSCIHKLKNVPSYSTVLIGRAVNGAESSLSENLFREAYIGEDRVIEIRAHETYPEWSDLSFVIGCYMVVVDSSASVEDINYSLQNHVYPDSCNIRVREGKWIITIDDYPYLRQIEDILRRYGIMKKGFRVEVNKGEQWKSLSVLHTIIDRLYHS